MSVSLILQRGTGCLHPSLYQFRNNCCHERAMPIYPQSLLTDCSSSADRTLTTRGWTTCVFMISLPIPGFCDAIIRAIVARIVVLLSRHIPPFASRWKKCEVHTRHPLGVHLGNGSGQIETQILPPNSRQVRPSPIYHTRHLLVKSILVTYTCIVTITCVSALLLILDTHLKPFLPPSLLT